MLVGIAALHRPDPAGAVGLPDLVVTAIEVPPEPVAPQLYPVTVTVENRGTAPALFAGLASVHLWYSADATLVPDGAGADTDLGLYPIHPTGFDPASGQPALLAGTASTVGPLPLTLPGPGYIFAWVDHFPGQPEGSVAESDEMNNVLSVPFAPGGLPDLVPTGLDAPAAADAGTYISVQWTVANRGTGAAAPGWHDGLYLSTDQAIGGDIATYGHAERRTVAAGAAYTFILTNVIIPFLPPGTYYLILAADNVPTDPDGLTVFESDEGNNVLAAVPLTVRAADLTVTDFTVSPAEVSAGGTVSFSYTVTNRGDAPAYRHFSLALGTGWIDGLQLSVDTTFRIGNSATTRILGGEFSPERLEPGQSYTRTGTRTVPADLPPGTWYLLVATDANHNEGGFRNVYEGGRDANNFRTAEPVLTATAANEPPSVDAGSPYEVAEGATATLGATGSDPDGDAPSFRWDLDGDGTFETDGASVTFDATGLDGPTRRTVRVRACDPADACAVAEATVDVVNVAPTATLGNSGPGAEGSPVEVAFANPTDPAAADLAGLRYAFACDGGSLDGADYAGAAPEPTTTCTFADGPAARTVRARVLDDDGGVTEYTTTVEVENLAPDIVSATGAPIAEGQSTLVTVEATDAGGDALSYAFDCDGDALFEVAAQPGNAANCFFDDSGSRAVNVQVLDEDGGVAMGQATVEVANVAPNATLQVQASVTAGATAEVALVGAYDPSRADAASLRYAFACGGESLDRVTYDGAGLGAATTCVFASVPVQLVRARVYDKDGGYAEYLAEVAVTPAAPTLTAAVQPPINADGSSVFNAKRGVVPVKFALAADGAGTCDLPPASIAVYLVGGSAEAPVNEAVVLEAADGGGLFRIVGCQYHYNLETAALGPGLYQVDVVIDGRVVGSAWFELRQ